MDPPDEPQIEWSKKRARRIQPTEEAVLREEEPDYDYSFLLARIYAVHTAPPLGVSDRKIPLPNVASIGTKRTCITNFGEICDRLQREMEHVSSYIQHELGARGSIDSNRQLTVKSKGLFKRSNIETVLKHYVREYVMCKECKCLETVMVRENRISFIVCQRCHVKKACATIRSSNKM